jgi:hypothetical protein
MTKPDPAGLEVTVMPTVPTKFAVMVPAPPIVAVVGDKFTFPNVIDAVLEPHDENAYPAVGAAESGLIKEFASYQFVPDGFVEPEPGGATAKVT